MLMQIFWWISTSFTWPLADGSCCFRDTVYCQTRFHLGQIYFDFIINEEIRVQSTLAGVRKRRNKPPNKPFRMAEMFKLRNYVISIKSSAR